jgi:hypothetical protein
MRTDRWAGALALGLLGVGLGPLAGSAQAAASTPSPQQLAATSAQTLRAATADAARQADLVTGEDRWITDALLKVRPDPQHPSAPVPAKRVVSPGLYTLVLTKRRQPYTFDDLRKLAADTLIPQPDGSFLLREHILVAAGATLLISPHKPLVIKMSSGPDGFTSLVTMGGRLRLEGSPAAPITFESWDESRGQTDRKVTDGRAYVRASGQLIVRHTNFTRLGFWSGRTGGLSVVGAGSSEFQQMDAGSPADDGAADPASTGPSSKQGDVLPTGKLPSIAADPSQSFSTRISDTTISGNAFGLFITGSSGPSILRTVIRKSLVDGLVLHRNVDSASISDVRVENSGQDGVVVSREVEGSVLTRLTVRQNGRDGIVLAGRPLAAGPSASGSSTRAFGNNRLTASDSIDNLRIGIHVIGGTAVRVLGNSVRGGRSGIVVSDGASDIDLDSNQVSDAAGNGIQVRESRQVTLTANSVRDSPTGIHIRNSVSLLRQNSTSGVTLHGITFVGQVAGSVVEANRLAGSGTSSIDVIRVTKNEGPTVKKNELSGWSRTVTGDSLLSALLHPLTVIWIFVALALVAMSRPRRAVSRLPYQATVPMAEPRAEFLAEPIPEPVPEPIAAPQFPEPAPRPVTLPVSRRSYREAEAPVFTLPERTPAPVHLPPPVQPAPVRIQASFAAPIGQPPPDLGLPPFEPGPPPAEFAEQLARLGDPAPGSALDPDADSVINLAIREARLSPALPRRRRSVGR